MFLIKGWEKQSSKAFSMLYLFLPCSYIYCILGGQALCAVPTHYAPNRSGPAQFIQQKLGLRNLALLGKSILLAGGSGRMGILQAHCKDRA